MWPQSKKHLVLGLELGLLDLYLEIIEHTEAIMLNSILRKLPDAEVSYRV